MGLVCLAIFVMQGHHYLLVRVVLLYVFLGIPHAVLWRELTAIQVTLVGIEPENLVKQNRVLRFFKLPSLLVSDSPCRFVVSVGFPRHPHVMRPALRVCTAVHVQTVA